MKMTALLAGAALLVMSAASANAQAAYNWSGFYVGADLGWANVKERSKVPAGAPCWWGCESYHLSGGSFLFGVHSGYQMQDDALVYGIEADIAGMNAGGTVNNFCSVSYCDYTEKVKLNELGSIRGRLGWDMGGILPFVTAGLAYGNVRNYVVDNNDEGLWDKTQFRAGYIFGGGIEYAMDDNCSVRIQADYYNLGSTTFISQSIKNLDGTSDPVKFSNDGYLATVGFSYRFNG